MADRLRVVRVVDETPDAKSLVFEKPPDFTYRPGQFLTLRVGDAARCYSLCSSPYTDDELAVTVKRTPDGYGSNWIHEHVVAGMELESLPPGGVFSPKSLDEDLVCCAAGSGITPIMSIVKSVLAAGAGSIVLCYANRDERSVIFRDALAALVEAHPDRLTVIHWLETVQGLPSPPALSALLRPYADREAFVCGPTPFMDAVSTALTELGAPSIRMERFLSLVKNPFERKKKPAAAADRTATVDVALDGERHTVTWPVNQRLLAAMRDAGLAVPSSCEEGRCGACVCRRTDGEITMANNEVLDDADLADGYVLACQSLPASDKVAISYE